MRVPPKAAKTGWSPNQSTNWKFIEPPLLSPCDSIYPCYRSPTEPSLLTIPWNMAKALLCWLIWDLDIIVIQFVRPFGPFFACQGFLGPGLRPMLTSFTRSDGLPRGPGEKPAPPPPTQGRAFRTKSKDAGRDRRVRIDPLWWVRLKVGGASKLVVLLSFPYLCSPTVKRVPPSLKTTHYTSVYLDVLSRVSGPPQLIRSRQTQG